MCNYKSIPDASPFCFGVNLHVHVALEGTRPKSTKLSIPNVAAQSVLITDCSSALVVIINPQMHPRCAPHTFQIFELKRVEDTTCVRLDF